VLLAASILSAGTGAVFAADLPINAPEPRAAYDWTGLYFGGHVGGAWGNFTFDDQSTAPLFNTLTGVTAFVSGPGALNASRSSFLGGVQAGWNYQIGRLVLGTKVDYSWTSMKPTAAGSFSVSPLFLPIPLVVGGSETIGASMTGIGTITTRLGVARDNWLFFGKLGGAWTSAKYSLAASDTISGFVTPLSGTSRDTRFGWTLGTGLEWAFASNWTAKVEYDYIDFGSWSESVPFDGVLNSFTGAPSSAFKGSTAVNVHAGISEVKFGINYKLNPGVLFW
jgi:outer membrane immunogenic protein